MRFRSTRAALGMAISALAGAAACNAIIGNTEPFVDPPFDASAAADAAPEVGASDGGLPPVEAGGCGQGLTLCNGNRCADLFSEVASCGSCTNDCRSLKNVSSNGLTCASGRCVIANCTAGYANCNIDAGDGCEVDTTRPDNCGACGTRCPANAPVCAPNDAGVSNCATGCGGNAPTLCQTDAGAQCVNTQTSANHCNACNNACPGPSSGPGNAFCDAGSCALACGTGFHRCSGNVCASDTDNTMCGVSCSDCLGGGCLGGKCDPLVLADGLGPITVHNDTIYWSAPDGASAKVLSCPLRGSCASPTVLATGVARAAFPQVVAAGRLWGSTGVSTITCPIAGCTNSNYDVVWYRGTMPFEIVSQAIASDGTSAYWTTHASYSDEAPPFTQHNERRLYRCSSLPCAQAPVHVMDGQTLAGQVPIASDGTFVAWSAMQLNWCSVGSCSNVTTEPQPNGVGLGPIAVFQGTVVGIFGLGIYSKQLPSGAFAPKHTWTSAEPYASVQSNAAAIYWLHTGTQALGYVDGAVFALPNGSTSPQRLTTQTAPDHLRVSGNVALWIANGKLVRLALP